MADEPSTFDERLIAVQRDLNAPKKRQNTFGGYSYRSAEDILEAVKPLLAQHGLLLGISDEMVAVGDRIYVKATASLRSRTPEGMDHMTVTAFAREEETKKGMDAAQITGSASSYARKYALNGLFLIDDDKDADTDEYHRQTRQDAPQQRPPVPIRQAPPEYTPQSGYHMRPDPVREVQEIERREQQQRATAVQRPNDPPTDKQINWAHGLWKQLGHTILGPDGEDHHDDRTLDAHCQVLFGTSFGSLTRGQMSELLNDLNGQVRAGRR